MQCGTVKATFSRRSALLVVEPHSMSALPSATAAMRLDGVTSMNSGVSVGRLIFLRTASASFRHNSTAYPVGFLSGSTYEKGTEDSRWAMMILPVCFIRSRAGPEGTGAAVAAEAVDAKTRAAAAARTAMV